MPTQPARRWTIKTTVEIRQWLRALRQADPETYRSVNVAIDMLTETGPDSAARWWTRCKDRVSTT